MRYWRSNIKKADSSLSNGTLSDSDLGGSSTSRSSSSTSASSSVSSRRKYRRSKKQQRQPVMLVDSRLDEVLPVKPNLAPSWADSLSIRGMRGYITTHSFFATKPLYLHDLETTIRIQGATDCRVLIYLPVKQKEDTQEKEKGVLIHFHGGGWSICVPEMEAKICRYMADNLQCIVIAPDYAKAPERYFPQALRQAHTVLNWITSPVTEDSLGAFLAESVQPAPGTPRFAFDRSKVAIMGGSSGGNIASAVTLLLQEVPLANPAQIVALGLQYPGMNLAMPYEKKLASLENPAFVCPPAWASKLFLRCVLPAPYDTVEQRSCKYVSPGLASDEELKQFPPTQICTGRNDHYRIESEEFAARLDSLGVRNSIEVFDKVSHAFDLVLPSDPVRRAASEAAGKESYRLLAQHISQYL